MTFRRRTRPWYRDCASGGKTVKIISSCEANRRKRSTGTYFAAFSKATFGFDKGDRVSRTCISQMLAHSGDGRAVNIQTSELEGDKYEYSIT